jgi:hypothetical protein
MAIIKKGLFGAVQGKVGVVSGYYVRENCIIQPAQIKGNKTNFESVVSSKGLLNVAQDKSKELVNFMQVNVGFQGNVQLFPRHKVFIDFIAKGKKKGVRVERIDDVLGLESSIEILPNIKWIELENRYVLTCQLTRSQFLPAAQVRFCAMWQSRNGVQIFNDFPLVTIDYVRYFQPRNLLIQDMSYMVNLFVYSRNQPRWSQSHTFLVHT